MAETLVPDTSVLVDGRISRLVADEFPKARVLVPRAALAELEAQANRGLETGFAGLDELQKLQHLAETGTCTIAFVGERPSSQDIERAETGAIDSLIRDSAVAEKALFVTSDRVQAYAAAASGVRHHYIRPITDDVPAIEELDVSRFFEEDIMSVHLKSDCLPMAKRGKPGEWRYEAIGNKAIGHKEIRGISRQCIEFAKRDYNSFLEIQRKGCTVVQLGPMRITIAQPPFSDGLEVTAVRPVAQLTIEEYDLPQQVFDRLEGRARGILIAGPPGSGKSTFAAAVALHLHGLERVIKTMESPRDLQLPREITQYGALDRDMKWTGEIILLVRPDHVIYDEVRTTDDFVTFADMRLAGIGLFGVSHANRPIDAVQRLIGRVDLGMIPQIVDTVIFIDAGRIETILELRFTVKVPEGMMSEDLARPVVIVHDLLGQKDIFELYSFGEQIVVMPLEQLGGPGTPSSGASKLAENELRRALRRYADGPMDVEVRGNKATVYVEEYAVPQLIGKGGRTVQGLEKKLGIRLDVRSRKELPGGSVRTFGGHGGGPDGGHGGGSEGGHAGAMPSRLGAGAPPAGPDETGAFPVHDVKKTGSNVFLILGPGTAGQWLRVEVDGQAVAEAKASSNGKLRFKANSPEGKVIVAATRGGSDIRCVVTGQ